MARHPVPTSRFACARRRGAAALVGLGAVALLSACRVPTATTRVTIDCGSSLAGEVDLTAPTTVDSGTTFPLDAPTFWTGSGVETHQSTFSTFDESITLSASGLDGGNLTWSASKTTSWPTLHPTVTAPAGGEVVLRFESMSYDGTYEDASGAVHPYSERCGGPGSSTEGTLIVRIPVRGGGTARTTGAADTAPVR